MKNGNAPPVAAVHFYLYICITFGMAIADI